MSFKVGGLSALQRAQKAESVNTVELENKLQISGVLKNVILANDNSPAYLQFAGPTQLAFEDKEIPGHSSKYHVHGYGTPLGLFDADLKTLQVGAVTTLTYQSQVVVTGKITKILKLNETAAVLSFENATATYRNEKLFLPEWGTYDIITGATVNSVYGGPADRQAFGDFDDFVAARVAKPLFTDAQKKIFSLYQAARNLRAQAKVSASDIENLFNDFIRSAPNHWLLFIELAEVSVKGGYSTEKIEAHLSTLRQKIQIADGLKLAHAKY